MDESILRAMLARMLAEAHLDASNRMWERAETEQDKSQARGLATLAESFAHYARLRGA